MARSHWRFSQASDFLGSEAVRSNNCDVITVSHYDTIIFSDLNIPLLMF